MFSKLSQDLNKASKSRYSFETISQHYLQTSFIFLLVYGRGSFTVLCFSLFCPRLQLSTQTYLGPVYKERGFSLCQGYGCVENKDLRPKNEDPRPPQNHLSISRNGYPDHRCVRDNNIFNCTKFRPGSSFSTQSPQCVENEDPPQNHLETVGNCFIHH